MAHTMPGVESFLSPSNKGNNEFIAVKLRIIKSRVAEVLHKTNVINIDQLVGLGLPRRFGLNNITHQ